MFNHQREMIIGLLKQHRLWRKGGWGIRCTWGLRVQDQSVMAYTDFESRVIDFNTEECKTDEDYRDTVLHEIAHVKIKRGGHDLAWARKAISIGCDKHDVIRHLVGEHPELLEESNG